MKRRKREALAVAKTGLTEAQFQQTCQFLFDRLACDSESFAWYWQPLERESTVEAPALTPAEWVAFQTCLFQQPASAWAAYTDQQMGMGLTYLLNTGVSELPRAGCDASISEDAVVGMLDALGALWETGVAPRLNAQKNEVGFNPLETLTRNWSDVWPLEAYAEISQRVQAAISRVLVSMLQTTNPRVQCSALDVLQFKGRALGSTEMLVSILDEFEQQQRPINEQVRAFAHNVRQNLR